MLRPEPKGFPVQAIGFPQPSLLVTEYGSVECQAKRDGVGRRPLSGFHRIGLPLFFQFSLVRL